MSERSHRQQHCYISSTCTECHVLGLGKAGADVVTCSASQDVVEILPKKQDRINILECPCH